MFRRRKDKPRRTLRQRLLRWLIVLLVIGAVGAVLSVEVTSHSKFCSSCHIMTPFYASWSHDVHSDVQCVECHIPPGATNYVAAKLNGLGQVVDDWLNRTSTKPSASVSALACTREGCHVMEEVDTSDFSERGYFFDHTKHINLDYHGIAVQCSTCHSHIKGQKHFEVNTNVCITCHMIEQAPIDVAAVSPADGAGLLRLRTPIAAMIRETPGAEKLLVAPANCASCHEPPLEPFRYQGLLVEHDEYVASGAACDSCHRNVTSKPQPISDSQCLACHVFGRERITTAEDMHRVHSEGEHKVECFNCHGWASHGPVAAAMSLNQFDCATCHENQHIVQRTTYLLGTPNGNGNGNGVIIPHATDDQTLISPMFLAHVDCSGCHTQQESLTVNPLNGATVAKAVPAACDRCHQDGFGEQMVPLWQRSTHEMYNAIVPLLPTETDPWHAGDPELEALVREARAQLDTVVADGSWGVHNPRFTQGLLEEARAKLIQAKKLADERQANGAEERDSP